jgi:hypothetical protein
MLNWFSELWCKRMHTKAMWPIHGRYVCSRCLREFTLDWEGSPRAGDYADPALRKTAPMHNTVTAYSELPN